MRLNILIVCDVYPPEPRGGARYAQMLARQLSQRGHRVCVCTSAFPGFPEYTEEQEVRVYRLSGIFTRIPFLYKVKQGRFPPPMKDWLLVRQLKEVITEQKPDVIHAQGWIVNSLLPAVKGTGIPLILGLPDYRAICPAAGMVQSATFCDMSLGCRCVGCSRELYGRGPIGTVKSLATHIATRAGKNRLDKVDRFIAVSSYVKNVHVKSLGIDASRFAVIPPFYTCETYIEDEAPGRLPDDFMLFVGALIPAKGVHVLIDAYHSLKTATKLVLIGIKYPGYSFSLGDGIILIENPNRNTILKAYTSCRFAVFPSLWPEPFGVVALEAMAYGKAVIASGTGGFCDSIVDAETGIMVSPDDADSLAQSMGYLLQNPQTALMMGQRGHERWQQLYTADAVIPEIEKLYESLLFRGM